MRLGKLDRMPPLLRLKAKLKAKCGVLYQYNDFMWFIYVFIALTL